MEDFVPGQRWINDAQLQLGLGTVLSSDTRSVTLIFLATGDSHTYSRHTAPLTRVHFSIGDKITSHTDEAITVTSVTETQGLLTYIGINETGQVIEIEEPLLNNFIQLNRPTERLFNGQIDKNKWFELRQQTLQHLNQLAHSNLRGLIGGRTNLIPHQLYIAHEVANRYAPRILLADEVGLGKTIEAGMILHQQLVTERIQRVLIVVPESLVHQWLVEMLRRFNLLFHVFNEQRCHDIIESNEAKNAFQTEQLILCSQEFLTQSPPYFQQCRESQWDLLVVDEAHHLQWTEEKASHEYEVIEELALQTKGVLLLTATPEQLGKESHFARLRLLDPNRFPSFEAFKEEEKHYEPIAHTIEQLLERQKSDGFTLDDKAQKTLESYRTEGDNQEYLDILYNENSTKKEKLNARNTLIDHLLDRHGTGRVLFRNTRNAIKGFPKRELYAYPLPLPECYQQRDNTSIQTRLSPELQPEQSCAENWVKEDPRVTWLSSFLRQQGTEKTLVITASATTVLDLAHTLLIHDALHASVFHEGMSLIERDRAAAFFADQEDGSPVLICSEIGSEGRNFQFAHSMVLFDLPLNPDLLEQRIGRLDRIGQTETIQIHTPYLENSAQEVLFNWYHHGLQAFEHTCPAGRSIFKAVKDELMQCLQSPTTNHDRLESLIQHTAMLLSEKNSLLQKGRDRLLEYSSCRTQLAKTLKQQALASDKNSNILANYMDMMFDCYGIDSEEYRENSYLLMPGKHMLTAFPGLREGGMAITYQREIALANEDLQYISWDHPLVSEAMDLVTTSEMGNASLIAIKHPQLRAGNILVETLHVFDTASAHTVQSQRYLPPTTIHMIINPRGNDISDVLSSDAIKKHQTHVDKKTANKLIKMKEDELRQQLKHAEQQAKKKTPLIIQQAHEQSKQIIETEINRLNAQQLINPNIRPEEIEFFEQQLHAVTNAINTANMRLDAVRIIVTI